MKTSLLEVILPGLMQVDCQQFLSGVDQFSSDRRGADFPRGVHYCATKELTGLCLSSVTVVGYEFSSPNMQKSTCSK